MAPSWPHRHGLPKFHLWIRSCYILTLPASPLRSIHGARVDGPLEISDLSHPPDLEPDIPPPLLCVPAQRTKKHFLTQLYWRDFLEINWLQTGKDESKIINVMACEKGFAKLEPVDTPDLSPHWADFGGSLRNLSDKASWQCPGEIYVFIKSWESHVMSSGRAFPVRLIWIQRPLSTPASMEETLRSVPGRVVSPLCHPWCMASLLSISIFLGPGEASSFWRSHLKQQTNFYRSGSKLGPYQGHKELQAKRILKVIRGITQISRMGQRKVSAGLRVFKPNSLDAIFFFVSR